MANTAKKEGTLKVPYRVTAGGKEYKVGTYKVKGDEYEALVNAPYVTEVPAEEAEAAEEKKARAKAAAKAAKEAKKGKVKKPAAEVKDEEPGDEGNDDNQGDDDQNGAEEETNFTKEELEALSEEDLRTLYAAECAKAGKNTPPSNIKVETIIANLTK